MKRLISYIVGAGLGLWVATIFIKGVKIMPASDSAFFGILIDRDWKFFVLFGIILGILNFFVKPVLDVISIPLKIITLGIFGILINAGLIWLVDLTFKELSIPLLWPLLWTTLIIWLASSILLKLINKEE